MQNGVNFYVPSAALGAALVVKLPSLVREWRSPLVRTVNTLILLHCTGFFFSAPPTIRAVNRFTGVSNLSALLVHCILCAYACTCLVLVENWREEAKGHAHTRRRVRTWIVGHCLVVVVIICCFVLGEAPDERPRDFDTYYATTPYIREMLVLYLVAHTVAAAGATAVCWRWARDLRRGSSTGGRSSTEGWLRAGLCLLVTGFLANLVFGVAKLLAIGARWAGGNWDVLNEGVAAFISVGAFVVTAGFLLPVLGPRFSERVVAPLRTFMALAPLLRVVRPPDADSPRRVLVRTPWYGGLERHLVNRMTNVQDWVLELRPYCTDEIRDLAHREAVRRGAPEPEAVAAGFAALFRAAAAARAVGTPVEEGASRRAACELRAAQSEYGDLMVRVSRSLNRSGRVRAMGRIPASDA